MTYAYDEPSARPPWQQQIDGFEFCKDLAEFALFMEQRTGKSRIIVARAALGFLRRDFDALLILAPNGVHSNWAHESLAEFLPKHIARNIVVWRTGKMKTVLAKERLARLLVFDGLAVLCMSYDALLTPTAKAYLDKFKTKRRAMMVADEADDLSTPGSKRTKSALALAKWGSVRAVTTGTPAAEGPFSTYAITNFLRFGKLGFTSALAFRHHYGEYPRDEETGEIVKSYNHNTGTEYETLVRDENGRPMYRNLEELHARLRPFTFFKTRLECGGQVPLYSRRLFELAPKQREIYETLREEFRAEIMTGTVSARMALTRMVRLQQITSGFVPLDRSPAPCPKCGGAVVLASLSPDIDSDCAICEGLGFVVPPAMIAELPNPRLEALASELKGTSGRTVIWTKFRRDGDAVCKLLASQQLTYGRYDGSVGPIERDRCKIAFQAGDLQHMVASEQAGGRGLDFSRARTAFFYSHHWSLRMRLQAQDRIENLNLRDAVLLVDLVAEETVDEPIVDAHRSKRNVQDVITGRPRSEWL